ncbi:hypothetical protein KEM48_005044 [Puccinia striiformis f. sp. tritici PST-130]|nr:hypothetical protein KEM48_005044 [Puccinia striiformis f. sp. tritici PST-130]
MPPPRGTGNDPTGSTSPTKPCSTNDPSGSSNCDTPAPTPSIKSPDGSSPKPSPQGPSDPITHLLLTILHQPQLWFTLLLLGPCS